MGTTVKLGCQHGSLDTKWARYLVRVESDDRIVVRVPPAARPEAYVEIGSADVLGDIALLGTGSTGHGHGKGSRGREGSDGDRFEHVEWVVWCFGGCGRLEVSVLLSKWSLRVDR